MSLSKILFDLRLDADEESLMFKSRDIYNAKTIIRRDILDSLSSIQTLMKKLNENENWDFNYKISCVNKLTHLFFSRSSFQKILQFNSEVLIMNYTYKINRYRMSLLIIIDQIDLNIIFYVAFAFIDHEYTSDY